MDFDFSHPPVKVFHYYAVMSKETSRWLINPLQLVRPDRIFVLFPPEDGSDIETFNALSRAILLGAGISYYGTRSVRDLILATVALGVAYILTNGHDEHLDSPAVTTPATSSTAAIPDTPAASATSATPNASATSATSTSQSRKQLLAQIESELPSDVVADTPPASISVLDKRFTRTEPNPQGVVKIRRGVDVPSSQGVASTGAKVSYLTMQPGESFPGQNATQERLASRGEIRHPGRVVPTREEIHAAYRPTPSEWFPKSEFDYMSGMVGPYKRIGRIV